MSKKIENHVGPEGKIKEAVNRYIFFNIEIVLQNAQEISQLVGIGADLKFNY